MEYYLAIKRNEVETQEWAWKTLRLGTSLVVQWLRLRAPEAGGTSSIPG